MKTHSIQPLRILAATGLATAVSFAAFPTLKLEPVVLQQLFAPTNITAAPDGSDGQGWYRYVLDNGKSTITGQRAGSLKDVTAHAAHCAEQINARGFGKQSLWSPRGRKPANAPKPADVTGS